MWKCSPVEILYAKQTDKGIHIPQKKLCNYMGIERRYKVISM